MMYVNKWCVCVFIYTKWLKVTVRSVWTRTNEQGEARLGVVSSGGHGKVEERLAQYLHYTLTVVKLDSQSQADPEDQRFEIF
jgi:hypothetical protein